MEPSLLPFTVALVVYVVVVLAVGLLATRRAASSAEEYFLAGRGLGTVVLFMALFGTNCTAFVLVGVPGQAYHDGVGVFGVNAPIVALGIPLTFWAIGSPARRMARRLGALTPAELYARRFGSRGLGQLLFTVFTLYTLPYMVTAVDGAAKTLASVTHGAVTESAGGLGVLAVALLYTSLGGMRATAWTNVIQGVLFMAFMLAAFIWIPRSMGGLTVAMEKVRAHDENLLIVHGGGLFEPRAWTSWGLAISLTVIAFPHMLVRLFAARSEESLKRVCRLYPVALLLLWLPAVMIGVWGAAEFPGLEGRASDSIFSLMVTEHLPAWLAACGFLAVLAAVMSTLDGQLLTLGSMLSRDVMKPPPAGAGQTPGVASGRVFGVVIAVVVYVLWRAAAHSIFQVASVAFSGYVTLAPTLFFGVRWRRFTVVGASASIVVGNAVYFLCLFQGGGMGAAMQPSWFGFLPVFWGFLAAVLAAVVGSLWSAPGDPQREREAFGDRVVMNNPG
ncbi:MAG: SSS family solute:Na+ symporter [Chlamydiales bacterium]|jgi:SSS family solute:Na+ symporter